VDRGGARLLPAPLPAKMTLPACKIVIVASLLPATAALILL
jgi:hypothetical protein